ncbi:hypothetical protein E2C01_089739 [Portunus trituberculatus]|uniref:Uncharacterized protein n=1 Tax=Portunus trituberculatus TaxID=210409 RepID=A0A5B7JJ29_PORTR|nr:hypothetical protein [Portunus trituberculatus]
MRDSLMLYFVHPNEARYVPAMLKGMGLWLISGTTVLYEPHCPNLYPLSMRERCLLAAPPQARHEYSREERT